MDRYTDRQADSSIPPKTFVLQGYNKVDGPDQVNRTKYYVSAKLFHKIVDKVDLDLYCLTK